MTLEAETSTSGMPLKKIFWAAFWSTILILAGLYLYANMQVAKLAKDEQGRVLVSQRYYDDWQAILPDVFTGMAEELTNAGDETEAIIEKRIDAAFAPVYGQMPKFLDFHYSVTGEYAELTAAVANNAGAELQRILFDEVDFDQRFNGALGDIQTDSDAILSAALSKINEDIQTRLDLEPAELAVLSDVVTLSIEDATDRFTGGELMLKSAGALAGAGAVTAVMTKAISKKIAAKLAAKATVKTAVKATGVGSGASGGAAVGTLCGPLAWVCVPVGGVVGAVTFWLATDKVIVEADEMLNRESFEEELRSVIDDEKARIVTELTSLYQRRLQGVLSENERNLQQITTRQLIEQGR